MRKHAYMIIAHNEEKILVKLLKLLDNVNNDIYIHIDNKSKELEEEKLKRCIKFSNVYFTKKLDVRWGDVSLTACELILLETATSNNKYDYYHLISGVDLPIKSQKEIHDFFEKNKGYEFIHFSKKEYITNHIYERVKFYHFFIKGFKSKIKFYSYFCEKTHNLLLKFQKVLKINRISKKQKVAYGSQWFSITDALARYVIENKKRILKRYKWTLCSDEMFLQTLVFESKFYKYIYKKSNFNSNLRYIDFERGNPYTFCDENFDEIMDSGCFFVRKLSTKNISQEKLVNKIYKKLKKVEYD